MRARAYPGTAWVLAVLGLAGCERPDEQAPAPRVLSVSPTQGTSQHEAALEITGRHFHPRVETDFTWRGGALRATFRAFLAPSSGGQPVELSSVRYVSSERLEARVPAGLARGVYDLVVVDPAGAEAHQVEAWRVVTSSENVAAFRLSPVGPQRVGVPFLLSLTAVDALGQPVDGFSGSVRLESDKGRVTPEHIGPFTLGRARALVTLWEPRERQRLRVEDALGNASRSERFEVRLGLAAHVAWTGAPLTLEAGACAGPVALRVQDALGEPADVEQPVPVELLADPPEGVALFSDAACARPLPPGPLALSGQEAPLYVRALGAGPLTLHASPSTLPGDTQAHTVRPGPAASLRFSSPARVLRAGECSAPVEVRVQDALGNPTVAGALLQVRLFSPEASGLGFHADAACTLPAGPLALAPESSGGTFHVRAPLGGRWPLGAEALAPASLSGASQEVLVEP